MLNHLLHWLVNSPWSHAINRAEWIFPVIQTFHFIGFALLIGTIAIVDLRLLGLGMRRQEPSELAADLQRYTYLGVALMLITGLLMFSTDAVTYHNNPSFQFKMTCFTAALVFHFTIHRRAVRLGSARIWTKFSGAISLLLWTGVVAGGRMIAFV